MIRSLLHSIILLLKTALISCIILNFALTNVALAQKTLMIDSQEAVDNYQAGGKALEAQDYAKAAVCYQKVIDLCPKMSLGYDRLGACLLKEDKLEEAVKVLQLGKDLEPPNPPIWANLAICLNTLGRPAEALPFLQRYVKAVPDGSFSAKCKSLIGAIQLELSVQNKKTLANGADDYLGNATAGGIYRWPAERMPLAVYIDVKPEVSDYRPSFELLFRQALQDWSDASKGAIRFKFVDSPEQANITCKWVVQEAELTTNIEAGHTRWLADSKGFVKCDIALLTRAIGSKVAATDLQAKSVDLHEIGHALGFTAHSPDMHDTMYSAVNAGNDQGGLTQRDKNTICALYALPQSAIHNDRRELPMAGDADKEIVKEALLDNAALKALDAGDYAGAVKMLEPAHQAHPESLGIALNLGVAYTNLAVLSGRAGNLEVARMYYIKGLDLLNRQPDCAAAKMANANYNSLLARMNNTKVANGPAAPIATTATSSPAVPDEIALKNRGFSALNMGNYAEAIKILQAGHDKYPNNTSMSKELGNALMDFGLQEADAGRLSQSDQYFSRAQALYMGGDDNLVKRHFLEVYIKLLPRLGRGIEVQKYQALLKNLPG